MIYKIIVENSDKTESRQYPIEIDALYRKGDVCDTIDVDSLGKMTVTRRLGIKPETGESYILPEPIIFNYGTIEIDLFEGINYLKLEDDNNTVLSVTYILKNEFTDTYATKVEMGTAIEQSAREITISAQATYFTKVDAEGKANKNTLLSEINVCPESVSINSNKISLAGKTIQLTSDNISIASNNFNVNNNGDIECNNAIVRGSVTIPSSKFLQINNGNNKLMFLDGWGLSYFDENGNSIGRYGIYHDTNNNKNIYVGCEKTRQLAFATWDTSNNSISRMMGIDGPANVSYLLSKLEMRGYRLCLYNQSQGYYLWGDATHPFNLRNPNDSSKYMEYYSSGDLSVSGNVYASNIGSDGRLKKDIEESDKNAIDIIKQLKHRKFKWKKDNKQVDIGYIAQEVEEIEPNFVFKEEIKDADGNVIDNQYYMNTLPIIATATKAIQEQQEEIDNLKNLVNQQNEQIDILCNKLNIKNNIEKPKKTKTRKKEVIKQYDENIKERPQIKEKETEKIKLKKEGK